MASQGKGSPCCPCGPSGCTLTISTTWCTCVAPGTITVVVKNASGVTVCSGTADGSGQFSCQITATGTYSVSASTSAGGYLNSPTSVTFTSVTGPDCSPPTVGTPLYPDQITASGFWGSATLFPNTSNCAIGSGIFNYAGSISFDFEAACTCGTASFTLQLGVGFCPGPDFDDVPLLSFCFPIGGPSGFCPGGTPSTGTGTLFETPIGGTPTEDICFPLDFSGTVSVDESGPILPGFLVGACSQPYSFPVSVTQ
jgi:hypothetical protein